MKKIILTFALTFFSLFTFSQQKSELYISGFPFKLTDKVPDLWDAKLKTYIKETDKLYIDINNQYAGMINMAEESIHFNLEPGTYTISLYPSVDLGHTIPKRYKTYEESRNNNTNNSMTYTLE